MQALPIFVKIPGASYSAGAHVSRDINGDEIFSFAVIRQFPDQPMIIVNTGEVRNKKSFYEEYVRKIKNFYECQVLVEMN